MSQRRSGEENDLRIELSKCVLDDGNKILWVGGASSSLPRKAVEVLCVLNERAGHVVSKKEIWESVWDGVHVEETNLTHNIYLLRRLFKQIGYEKVIETVPRVGYRFLGKFPASETPAEPAGARITPAPIRRVPEQWRALVVSILLLLILSALGTAYYSYRSGPRRLSKSSIAILPLRTIGQGADVFDNAAGLTDLLITRLGNLRNLAVTPVTAAAYPTLDLATSPADIGRQLNVDAVLDWSIYRNERQVRVTLRLVDPANGTQLWGGQFERPLESEFSLQNDITELVASALSLDLTDEEKFRISQNITTDADAYQLYLKARVEWNKRNPTALAEAQNLFRNAIKKDPKFALAYVGLADSLIFNEDSYELGAAIDRAIELDPKMGEAYASRGFHRMVHGWDWKGAEEDLRRSISLDPHYATAHQWLAVLLSIERRLDEAEVEMGRALEISPGSYNFIAGLGQIYYFKGDLVKAEEYCRRSIEINPDFVFAHEWLAQILYAEGRYEAAFDEGILSRTMLTATSSGGVPQPSDEMRQSREILHRAGETAYLQHDREQVLGMRNNGQPDYPLRLAILNAKLGQWEDTLQNLDAALKRHPFMLPWINVDPLYNPIREDKRFIEIIGKIGIPRS